MGGVGKADKSEARKPARPELGGRISEPIAQAMAATRLAQSAEAIRTSPMMQARAAAVRSAFGPALEPKPPVQRVAPSNRTGLPDALKAGVEAMSGLSMDDVRVHRNSPKPAELQAHAYAQGTQIHLGPGQEKHLPHEAWHVVQQKQGRVKPTLQMKGVAINDDSSLEREAEAMGAKALAPAAQLIGGPRDKEVLQGKTAPVLRKSNGRGLSGRSGSGLHRWQPAPRSQVVQALMSVGAFQGLTPGSRTKPRKAILLIDAALANYNASAPANKVVAITNLIGVLTTYINGQHDAGRIITATALRTDANAELALLTALGAANYGLIDDLMLRSGGAANIAVLTALVTTATVAHAAHLPALLTIAGGAGGLLALDALITTVGVANIPYLSGALAAVGVGRSPRISPISWRRPARRACRAFRTF